MRNGHVMGTVLLLVLAPATFACTLPALVAIPAKDKVGDQAPALREAMRVYFEGVTAYTECVQAELASADANGPPIVKALLIARNNATVAEAAAVARLFEDNVELAPIFKVRPEYPPSAMRRNLEGWVKMQFTVTPAGTVEDAVVVDADPKGYFEEAALASIAQWRYSPRVERGVPVARVGVQTIIIFKLEP
ncbi:MAG TPA: energy transducer TonB [Gammaproteobacteria bacterium]|nr:energy transducer TonB [Gammaproteobacteria bacterium]